MGGLTGLVAGGGILGVLGAIATYYPPAAPYIGIASTVVSVAGVVATQVKPPPAGSSSAVVAVYKAINWFALNVGQAKNANAP